jgi:adenylosuccinate lyase
MQFTTQIEHYDALAAHFDALKRINNILIDLCRDIWTYISMDYFKQKTKKGEVGSSAMPHKVNPIDFENAEGNLGLANSILEYFSNKLPISRWQRDLSDSTVLRNLGSALGYCIISYQNILNDLDKLNLNTHLLRSELNNHWEILAEPIQTVMRRYGITDAYEQLKDLTRISNHGELNQALLHEFINNQALPKEVKESLKKLTPSDYTGYASLIVDSYIN